jgi:mycothiol synthase
MPLRAARLPADWPDLEHLFHEIERLDGYDPLTEDAYLAVDEGCADPGVLAEEGKHPVGYAHVRRGDGVTTVETALHPVCRPVLTHLLLSEAIAERPAERIRLWASDGETLAAAAELGFEEVREIRQLVRPLPPADPVRVPSGIDIRLFRPERDVAAFLEVNNAAFVGHPDNGGWTPATVHGRMQRAWFDPDGFFLAWDRARPVGTCWTKLHRRRVGEIYVVAVHPDVQGRSLGTALVLTGLWDLYERHGATTATLYVEADNTPALTMYRRLGFDVLRSKRCVERAPIGG